MIKKQQIKEFSLKKGIWVAIFAGVMSACFAFGIAAGKPIAEMAIAAGATVVGRWPTDDYDFLASAAVDGDQFLGLPLDEENQAAFTEKRIAAWVEQLLAEAF